MQQIEKRNEIPASVLTMLEDLCGDIQVLSIQLQSLSATIEAAPVLYDPPPHRADFDS